MAHDMVAMERTAHELQKRYTQAEADTYIATNDANQLHQSLTVADDMNHALLTRIHHLEQESSGHRRDSQQRLSHLEQKLR
jgi:hypothetical protein